MRRFFLCLAVALLPFSALAQDNDTERDRDFLTGFLEDNLSALGRSVRIDGFKGALSSRATFDQLTIADDQGVWLTIRKGAIGWNRTALLSGRVEISEMSAAEIDLPRQPGSSGPSAEASGFSLPELPVSVDIGLLRADRVVLGQDLFGAAATVALDGKMHLEGGEGTAELSVKRVDGKEGTVAFTGSYANATRKATLDLLVAEGKDGIAANMLGLPGVPSIQLAVSGSGLIDDFRTDVSLSTDGAPRLVGRVTLLSKDTGAGTPERSFAASLAGDITPLLLPEYHDFVGTDVSLEAEGRRSPDGRLDLTRLVLGSEGFDLSGRLSLGTDGLPLQAALTARMGLADAGEVLLPLPGARTFVRAGDLKLRYDQTRGNGWTLAGMLYGFRREGITIGSVSLDGSGAVTLAGQQGATAAGANGSVAFVADGIATDDAALASAIGSGLSGKASFDWQDGAPFRIPGFDVTGQGYGATGEATISTPEDGSGIQGRIRAEVADMGRFSGLAGRPLGGAGEIVVAGSGGLFSGIFDLTGSIVGRDLSAGQAELDRLLAGESRVEAAVRRDTGGITIEKLDIAAATLTASATGTIGTRSGDIDAKLDFSDLSVLGKGYRGRLTGTGKMVQDGTVRHFTLDAEGGGLGIGQAEIDRVLAGRSNLHVAASEEGGKIRVDTFDLTNPQLSAKARGEIADSARRIDIEARLNNMALLAPGFEGPLTASGVVRETGAGYAIDMTGQGPGATSAKVSGTLSGDFSTADLAIAGAGQSAIINPFIEPRNIAGPVSYDLRLSGPLALSSLSGRVALSNGRLVAPTFGVELDGVNIGADLAGGRATLGGQAGVKGGGQLAISGPVALTKPYDGSLTVTLTGARLRDPELYDTTVNGTVSVQGPMAGGATIAGQIVLGRTEIRIPSSTFGTAPVLTGMIHEGESAASRDTRARAGLIEPAGNEKVRGPAYGIDLTIAAPERIFVRGRGLDAEMGGSLRLTGTTDNIVPSGRFSLIRGRLDILGKRFDIDEGLVELQGALTPYVRFSAASENDGVTSTIIIEGDASAPEITFQSSPELPQEEVVAQLLFGRGLSDLSPLQAAQLASAIATLAGKGGEGIVSKLRNSFGLDDLDVTTGDDGSAAVRAGKYLSEKVYTDVTVGSDGKSEINLNLEVSRSLTARGTLGSDGGTGVGLYWERDY